MPPLPGRDPRYETLDVWRGVACLMVVLHHSGFYALQLVGGVGHVARGVGSVDGRGVLPKNMDLGVPLFFVISGYCIAASMDSHRRRGSSSWVFLGRRLRRIYPPYWAALLVFVVVTWALDQAGWNRLHNGAHSLELDSPGKLEPGSVAGQRDLDRDLAAQGLGRLVDGSLHEGGLVALLSRSSSTSSASWPCSSPLDGFTAWWVLMTSGDRGVSGLRARRGLVI